MIQCWPSFAAFCCPNPFQSLKHVFLFETSAATTSPYIALAHACPADLVGGIESVTLGDEEAKSRGCQKTILERRAPPTFPIVIEMRDRSNWVAHATEQSVDALLLNKVPRVQVNRDLRALARLTLLGR